MTPTRLLRDESGFTLQELMVVILIGSILIAFAFELFLFANRLFSEWRHHEELRSLTESVLERVATDIREAKAAQELTDSSFVLIRHDGRTIEYRFGSGRAIRCATALVEQDVHAAITVVEAGSVGRTRVFDISVELKEGRSKCEARTSSSFELTARSLFTSGISSGGF